VIYRGIGVGVYRGRLPLRRGSAGSQGNVDATTVPLNFTPSGTEGGLADAGSLYLALSPSAAEATFGTVTPSRRFVEVTIYRDPKPRFYRRPRTVRGGGNITPTVQYSDTGTELFKFTPSFFSPFIDGGTVRLNLLPSAFETTSQSFIQRPVGPVALNVSAMATYYVVPAGHTFQLRNILVCNTNSVARVFSLSVAGQMIFNNQRIEANDFVPWDGFMLLKALEVVQAQSDGSGVTLSISGVEV
jgi:hypothetical protein